MSFFHPGIDNIWFGRLPIGDVLCTLAQSEPQKKFCNEPNRSGSPAQEEAFCDEFHLVDLRVYDNCKKVVKGCDHVFNLAADMGGRLPVASEPK
jgi:hypothetical protein